MSEDDDDLVFANEEEGPAVAALPPWDVLVVDDDVDVHRMTGLALGDFRFEGRALHFISAHSAAEAERLLGEHPDTAVVLLDVVMEADDAGLRFVRHIREVRSNRLVRIILRTGQPGYAPENHIILEYDINDYRAKVELTTQKLFTSMVAALRGYRDLCLIESGRRAVEARNVALRRTNAAVQRFVPNAFLRMLGRPTVRDVRRGDHVSAMCSVMFCDLRGFTARAEAMGPEATFSFINDYMGLMEPEVRRHRGFTNQYIGDGIMALFPRSSDSAVSAGIALVRALGRMRTWSDAAPTDALRVGIGVNTGPVMLGIIGGRHLDTGVVGDAVNLAARVEGMTRMYDVNMITTESTVSRLANPEAFSLRELDHVVPRGRREAVRIYEVLDAESPERRAAKEAGRERFAEGVAHFRGGRIEAARAAFSDGPDWDVAASMYVQRCDTFLAEGLPADWAGVTALSVK